VSARLGVLALALAICAAPGRADVFEIGSNGTVLVRAGVGAVAWNSGDPDEAEPAPDVPTVAVTTINLPVVPQRYGAALAAAAQRAQLSPSLLAAVIHRESGWRADAVSPKGATGLAQLMPATARSLGVDPRDPGSAMTAGALYLRALVDRFSGDIERGLAAYNAGPKRVERAGGIPEIAETRSYVSTILAAVGGGIAQGGIRP